MIAEGAYLNSNGRKAADYLQNLVVCPIKSGKKILSIGGIYNE